jgi:hypothetical protein
LTVLVFLFGVWVTFTGHAVFLLTSGHGLHAWGLAVLHYKTQLPILLCILITPPPPSAHAPAARLWPMPPLVWVSKLALNVHLECSHPTHCWPHRPCAMAGNACLCSDVPLCASISLLACLHLRACNRMWTCMHAPSCVHLPCTLAPPGHALSGLLDPTLLWGLLLPLRFICLVITVRYSVQHNTAEGGVT